MAFTTINKSSLYHNTILYTDSGAVRTLTGVGFQPDFTWIKTRNHTNSHCLFDSVRGANKVIRSNNVSVQATTTDTLTAFTSDGFSLGADASGYGVNYDNKNEIAWNWKMGTTSGITTNGSTTITPLGYSFNATAGQSVIHYNGNQTAGDKVPHGLGVKPDLIIIKDLDAENSWQVQHSSLGATKYLSLDSQEAQNTNTNRWNDTEPDSVNFTLGSSAAVNGNDNNYIAYCFANKIGYSKMGSYVGNGNTNGVFIYTGFKPSYVIFKGATTAYGWYIMDNARDTYNIVDDYLYAQATDVAGTHGFMDFVSNGFKIRESGVGSNTNGETYVYIAFGQTIVGSNNTPATAR